MAKYLLGYEFYQRYLKEVPTGELELPSYEMIPAEPASGDDPDKQYFKVVVEYGERFCRFPHCFRSRHTFSAGPNLRAHVLKHDGVKMDKAKSGRMGQGDWDRVAKFYRSFFERTPEPVVQSTSALAAVSPTSALSTASVLKKDEPAVPPNHKNCVLQPSPALLESTASPSPPASPASPASPAASASSASSASSAYTEDEPAVYVVFCPVLAPRVSRRRVAANPTVDGRIAEEARDAIDNEVPQTTDQSPPRKKRRTLRTKPGNPFILVGSP